MGGPPKSFNDQAFAVLSEPADGTARRACRNRERTNSRSVANTERQIVSRDAGTLYVLAQCSFRVDGPVRFSARSSNRAADGAQSLRWSSECSMYRSTGASAAETAMERGSWPVGVRARQPRRLGQKQGLELTVPARYEAVGEVARAGFGLPPGS